MASYPQQPYGGQQQYAQFQGEQQYQHKGEEQQYHKVGEGGVGGVGGVVGTLHTLDEGTGCAVVSSTSAHEQEQSDMRGAVRQHDNIGSIITMLIADQSVDLEDILTDNGIRSQEGQVLVTGQASLQETTIKEDPENLGIEYTNYSPDYSMYQREFTVGETEPTDTARSRFRSLSSLSSCSEGDEEGAQVFRADGSGYQEPRQGLYSTTQYRGGSTPKPGEKKDDKYWERRRKNNLAAKKSRDARRVRC